MADIVVRKLAPAFIESLKRQAAENGRSMEAEARAILEDGVTMTMAEWVAEMDRLRAGSKPLKDTLTAADLIHEGRREREAALSDALGWDVDETDD